MVLFGFIRRRIKRYKQNTLVSIYNLWDNFIKGGTFGLLTATVFWLSVFIYLAFYYYYMPTVYHEKAVNLQFKQCKHSDRCTYPTAHVQLTKRHQILMIGQTYEIYLKLELPESDANRNLGMFMACADLADKKGRIVSSLCTASMLHYRSDLLTKLNTLAFYPLFAFGRLEEKQILTLQLASNYEEDQAYPVTDIYVELKTNEIEYYSASLCIQANLRGLRYAMFHWPLFSAALGIFSSVFFIFFIVSISCWHYFGPTDKHGRRNLGPNFKLYFGRNLFNYNEGSSSDESFHDSSDKEISIIDEGISSLTPEQLHDEEGHHSGGDNAEHTGREHQGVDRHSFHHSHHIEQFRRGPEEELRREFVTDFTRRRTVVSN